MEPQLGLRFLMADGHHLEVGLPQGTALQIVHDWTSNHFRLKDKTHFNGESPEDRRITWSVKISSIIAVHTFVLRDKDGVDQLGKRSAAILAS